MGYYLLKTIREPLILNTGGAEGKAFSSAGQAIVLMAYIPLYSWFASRVGRLRLCVGMNVFAAVNMVLVVVWLVLSVVLVREYRRLVVKRGSERIAA